MQTIPQDPYMLLSFVNLKLRDYYTSPAAMCDDLELNLSEVEAKLKSAGYVYDRQMNQFIS